MNRIAGVVLVAFVLVTAACGGSSSSALSKDEFVKQGNAICQKGNDAINSVGSSQFSGSSQPDPAAIQKFFNETVAPNIKKQIDDIAALKPPSDLKSGRDKMVADARAALAKLQSEVASDPNAAFNDQSQDPFADVNKEATAIGLATCASNGDSSSS